MALTRSVEAGAFLVRGWIMRRELLLGHLRITPGGSSASDPARELNTKRDALQPLVVSAPVDTTTAPFSLDDTFVCLGSGYPLAAAITAILLTGGQVVAARLETEGWTRIEPDTLPNTPADHEQN